MILYRYSKEKFHLGHSQELKGYVTGVSLPSFFDLCFTNLHLTNFIFVSFYYSTNTVQRRLMPVFLRRTGIQSKWSGESLIGVFLSISRIYVCLSSWLWVVSCGHTTDFNYREIDLQRTNFLNSPMVNLSWVSISQDQKVTPAFVTGFWVQYNKTAKYLGCKHILCKHAWNSRISIFFSLNSF